MKNMAYKVTQGDPNYPDGFVKDFFATDQDTVEGYNIVPFDEFPKLMLANRNLMNSYDPSKNPPTSKNAGIPNPKKAAPPPTADDAALFQQFLQWKKSQQQGS